MENNEFDNTAEENSSESHQRFDWLKYSVIIALAGFCIPVINMIYDHIPGFLIFAAAAVLLILIIKAACERDRGIAVMKASDPERVETCSDIKSLRFNLNGGTFVINQGINFSVNGTDEKNFKSYIKNGIWHFESINKSRGYTASSDAYPVTISLPQNFNAEKASINMTRGKLLIYGISAYNMSLNGEGSDTDVRNMYAKRLELRCSDGNTRANIMTDGDVNVVCSRGKLGLRLGCYPDSLNYIAKVKNGRITIADRVLDSGSMFVDNHAAKNVNVTCDGGETIIKFGREAENNA